MEEMVMRPLGKKEQRRKMEEMVMPPCRFWEGRN
jgi:hypothetical protein